MIIARGGHQSQIQEAVDQAISQDDPEVQVPAGTFPFHNVGENWTPVVRPPGISIIGFPSEKDAYGNVLTWKTILTMNYSVPGDSSGVGTWNGGTQIPPPPWFTVSGSSVRTPTITRLGDMKLAGYRSIDPNDHQSSVGQSIYQVLDYRMDHMCLENICDGGVQAAGKYCCGVTDHSLIYNTRAQVTSSIYTCDVGYGASFFRNNTEDLWDAIDTVLGKYTNYSHFMENCYYEKWRHCIAANQGAHYIIRYSKFDKNFGFGDVDAHGTYENVGTRAIEIYENSFTNCIPGGTVAVAFWRGGGGTFFNNTIDSTYMWITFVAEGTVEKCWPHDVYVWNNSPIGLSTTSNPQMGSDGILHPAMNVDIFTVQKNGYVPYTYPHPLTLSVNPTHILNVNSNLQNIPFNIRKVA